MNKIEQIVTVHTRNNFQSLEKKAIPETPSVAIYVRLSDEDRDKQRKEEDSESIKNQKSLLEKYVNDHGWVIYDTYSDDDYSGTDKNRPEFKRMLKDCEDGKIDIVLCKTQSRFSRDLEIVEKYIHGKFQEWNVRFISVVDHADTSIKSNKKARQINGLINEWYLEDLSDNIRKVIRHKKESGQYTGSFAPYGYLRDPKDKYKLIIDPDAEHVIRLIFKKYMDGEGYSKIAVYLTENDIPTPVKLKQLQGSNFVCTQAPKGNSTWCKDTIRKILMNEVYIGNLVQGKVENISYKSDKVRNVPKDQWIIVENTHEPIVDMETWEAVQRRFEGRSYIRTSYRTGEVHLFSKKVYCSVCGKSMAKSYGNSKNHRYEYLRCRGKAGNPLTCSNGRMIRYDMLEELVIREIDRLLATYRDNIMVETSLEQEYNIHDEKAKQLKILFTEKMKIEETLAKKKGSLKSLYQDKEDGIFTVEEFVALKQDWNEDITRLNNQIETIKTQIQGLEEDNKKDEAIETIAKKYKTIKKIDRTILDIFIKNIYVGQVDEENKTRKIDIEWAI